MKAKSLLIPVAAFAVTVTGASAFNSDVFERAGLTSEQISAFEEAHELRKEGDRDAARDVLVEAGVNMEIMEKVREAMHENHVEQHSAIEAAVSANDFEAFRSAVDEGPLAEIIDTHEEFDLFVEAFNLRAEGMRAEARAIFDELGLVGKHRGHHGKHAEHKGSDGHSHHKQNQEIE